MRERLLARSSLGAADGVVVFGESKREFL